MDSFVPNNPLVVGALPFDNTKPAQLFIPLEAEWKPTVSKSAAPSLAKGTKIRLHGEESPLYHAAVAKALRRISLGKMEKVVLARRIVVETDRPFDVDTIYERLSILNRDAYVYQLDLPVRHLSSDEVRYSRQPPILMGASPELVVGSRGARVKSNPLAGSIPRCEDPFQDEERGNGLLHSQKDLHEHALVVRAVGAQFRRLCHNVTVPEKPELVKTPIIWHLSSQISGLLRTGVHPIELASALHPTPAVSGWPQKAAQLAITELEDFDRGYYAGLIGWMDAEGNSDWALSLRCGIVDGSRAEVFAGAGIVASSDPTKEHTETATKMRTFLSALGCVEGPANLSEI